MFAGINPIDWGTKLKVFGGTGGVGGTGVGVVSVGFLFKVYMKTKSNIPTTKINSPNQIQVLSIFFIIKLLSSFIIYGNNSVKRI
jgi:hypothetical protein